MAKNNEINRLLNAARDGDRLVMVLAHVGQSVAIWQGLGNRSGLHSYASELLADKWAKGEARLTRTLEKAAPGTVVEVQTFRNITRDRGRWTTVAKVTLP